jgi:hypothetical protein
MANLEEVVARAATIAESKAGDGNLSPLIDMGEWTAETLFPHAVEYTVNRLAYENDDKIQDLITGVDVVFTSGSASLPTGVLKDFMKFVTAADRKFFTYLPYADFIRYRFDQVCDYLTLEGGTTLKYKRAGTDFSGTQKLYLVIKPALPGTITDPIPLSDRILEDVILVLASVMSGEMKIGDLLKVS